MREARKAESAAEKAEKGGSNIGRYSSSVEIETKAEREMRQRRR